jgi:hypothetical protein
MNFFKIIFRSLSENTAAGNDSQCMIQSSSFESVTGLPINNGQSSCGSFGGTSPTYNDNPQQLINFLAAVAIPVDNDNASTNAAIRALNEEMPMDKEMKPVNEDEDGKWVYTIGDETIMATRDKIVCNI